jgi:hypothetical protein
LKEENIYLKADNKPEAEKKCEEEAKSYDGFDVEVDSIGQKEFNCKFRFWR